MQSFQLDLIPILLAFVFIALASRRIGEAALGARLPLISGYLIAGMVAGPYVLGLIPDGVPERLRFLDELSLAVIAFAAGAELYLRELRGRFQSIAWVTAAQTLATFTFGALAVVLLADLVPFLEDFSIAGRVAVALLAGAILVARSPSSAIAIVNELRAKGPFTQAVLGVTVITDVVVIVLFAIGTSTADAILSDLRFDPGFVGLLVLELLLSLALGWLVWRLLQVILGLSVARWIRAGLVLLAGYAVFVASTRIRAATHSNLPIDILIEPLLVCMIAGFLTTNYGRHREIFSRILHDVAPPVYVIFFTLTGASLALDVLTQTWTLAAVLFVVRLVTIFIGSFGGGLLARDTMEHNRLGWMAYVTQAGVGLGLAREVAVEFPSWGTAFATLMISVIVVNQLVGPPLMKLAIRKAGEAHSPAAPHEFDGVRDAIIFGLDAQSVALANQLLSHGWQVKVAALDGGLLDQMEGMELEVRRIDSLTRETLNQLEADKAEAIVAMMSDDQNYAVCELAYEHFGTETLVVRLRDRAQTGRFRELGAMIVDPGVAIVSLLDHLVRSPEGASLLLGMHKDQDIVDLEMRNTWLDGRALRDMRLPSNTLILSIRRGDEWLLSHGYTRLRVGDKVTAMGSQEGLDQLALQLEA